jgi:hypothetical protein
MTVVRLWADQSNIVCRLLGAELLSITHPFYGSYSLITTGKHVPECPTLLPFKVRSIGCVATDAGREHLRLLACRLSQLRLTSASDERDALSLERLTHLLDRIVVRLACPPSAPLAQI